MQLVPRAKLSVGSRRCVGNPKGNSAITVPVRVRGHHSQCGAIGGGAARAEGSRGLPWLTGMTTEDAASSVLGVGTGVRLRSVQADGWGRFKRRDTSRVTPG